MVESMKKTFKDRSLLGKIGRIVQLPLALFVANQSSYPIIEATRMSMTSYYIEDANKAAAFKGMEEQDKKTLTSRNYLDISTLIVSENIRNSNDDALMLKCDYLPRAILDMYKRIISGAGRGELKDRVRIVAGPAILSDKYGHVWLQIQESVDWVNYETTRYISRNQKPVARNLSNDGYITENESIREYSARTVKLRGDAINEFDNEVHFVSDGLVFWPTVDAFTYKGGLARLTYDLYQKNKK
jgi:hypothetical protein